MWERQGDGAVRVAGGQGFYGDAQGPLADLLTEKPDYVCLEALAELTLAILAKDRQRDEALGYTRDLPLYLMHLLPAVLAGDTKVITNAGGINPLAALHMLQGVAGKFGLSGMKIGLVLGDDLKSQPELIPDSFPPLEQLQFANAYLGVGGIVEALEEGADVVITGRVADAALFLAPLVHEHGWSLPAADGDDQAAIDRLAAGTVVGHLLECSGQSTGGNNGAQWWTVPDPWRFGFPLADVTADGTATIFSPQAAGGRVDFDSVRQQLLYEVGDPTTYLTPDVIADMTSVQPEDLGDGRVRLTGVSGRAATGKLKAVGASKNGYLAEMSLAFAWPDAPAKARAAADIARKRIAEAGIELEDWHVELFGVNALHGPAAPMDPDPAEVVLRLVWKTATSDAAMQVGRHVIPMALSGPPSGLSPANRARPKPSGLLEIHTDLIDAPAVRAGIRVIVEEL